MREQLKSAVVIAAWITGVLGCMGVVIAAIIGLGSPLVQRLAQDGGTTPVILVVTATPGQSVAAAEGSSGVPQQPTEQPASSTPSFGGYIPPAAGTRMEERQETGVGVRAEYDVELASDEVVVGDSYGFQDSGALCNAFLIQGPGRAQFVVLDGAWYRYSGVTTQDRAEELLRGRITYLQNHWFCRDVGVNVVRLRAGE